MQIFNIKVLNSTSAFFISVKVANCASHSFYRRKVPNCSIATLFIGAKFLIVA
jgi:hypothetical protein